MLGKTEGINHYTVEHYKLGRGGAILTKQSHKPQWDRFMCSFGNERKFYLRKHFHSDGEIWFVDPNAPVKPRRKRKKTEAEALEEQLRQFFSPQS